MSPAPGWWRSRPPPVHPTGWRRQAMSPAASGPSWRGEVDDDDGSYPGPLILAGHGEEEPRVVAWPVDRLGNREVGIHVAEPAEPHAHTRGGCMLPRRKADAGLTIEQFGAVREPVDLGLADVPEHRQIEAKLGVAHIAAVAQQLGRVVGATEEAAAEAALLGREQRRGGVLPVAREIHRKRTEQRLNSARHSLDLCEIDPPISARSERIAVRGAVEPVDALAHSDIELVDAAPLVRHVGIDPEAGAADAVFIEAAVENIADAVAPKHQRGERQVFFATAYQRIAETGVAIERLGFEIKELKLRRAGLAETVARVDESREAFCGQHLPITRRDVVELLGRHHARIGDGESIMDPPQVVGRHRAEILQRAARRGAAIIDLRYGVYRLVRDLDQQRRRVGVLFRGFEAGREFQARQVAGEQQITLDGAHI